MMKAGERFLSLVEMTEKREAEMGVARRQVK